MFLAKVPLLIDNIARLLYVHQTLEYHRKKMLVTKIPMNTNTTCLFRVIKKRPYKSFQTKLGLVIYFDIWDEALVFNVVHKS